MATVDYKPFANDAGANVVTQAEYVSLLASSLQDGMLSGEARSNVFNKVFRQSSVMTAAVAQFLSQSLGDTDVLDDGDVDALALKIRNATGNQVFLHNYPTLQAAVDAAGSGGEVIVLNDGTPYTFNTPCLAAAPVTLRGVGRPIIQSTTNGVRIFGASGVPDIQIEGIVFKGSNSSTVPTSAISGMVAINCGLVTLYNCPDARVVNCKAERFYNGIVVAKSAGAYVCHNDVINWFVYGILGSQTSRGWFDNNNCDTCDRTGANNAYGIMVTGDDAGGSPSDTVSICNNFIKRVRSWDAIMSHDIKRLKCTGNIIEDTRCGIDISAVAGSVIEHLDVSGNIIRLTDTDEWAGVAAICSGIQVFGIAGAIVKAAIVNGNQVSNFGAVATMVQSSTSAPIAVQYIDHCEVEGNVITECDSQVGIPGTGVAFAGTFDTLSIQGNTVAGNPNSGAIRSAGATVGLLTITSNTMDLDNPANTAVYLPTGTITKAIVGGNNTNATALYTLGATITESNIPLSASLVHDFGSVANGSTDSADIVVTGAVVGDYVRVSCSTYLDGMSLFAEVSVSNTVRVRVSNNTGGAVNLASCTFYVTVTPRTLS